MTRRTERQNEADRIDLDLYRLQERLSKFSKQYASVLDQPKIEGMAATVCGMRGLIRSYMHKDDREHTK